MSFLIIVSSHMTDLFERLPWWISSIYSQGCSDFWCLGYVSFSICLTILFIIYSVQIGWLLRNDKTMRRLCCPSGPCAFRRTGQSPGLGEALIASRRGRVRAEPQHRWLCNLRFWESFRVSVKTERRPLDRLDILGDLTMATYRRMSLLSSGWRLEMINVLWFKPCPEYSTICKYSPDIDVGEYLVIIFTV